MKYHCKLCDKKAFKNEVDLLIHFGMAHYIIPKKKKKKKKTTQEKSSLEGTLEWRRDIEEPLCESSVFPGVIKQDVKEVLRRSQRLKGRNKNELDKKEEQLSEGIDENNNNIVMDNSTSSTGKGQGAAVTKETMPCNGQPNRRKSKSKKREGRRDLEDKENRPEEPAVVCVICGESWRDEMELMNHIGQCHTRETPYFCKFCDECFTNSSGLHSHVNRAHFRCGVCNLDLKSMASYKEHIFLHKRNTFRRPFDCKTCGKRSKFYMNHLRHISKWNHQSGVLLGRQFPCSVCPSSFSHLEKLKIHIKSKHFGRGWNGCSKCNMTFQKKHAAFRHEILVHGTKISTLNM